MMSTIFDYKVSTQELKFLYVESTTKEEYLQKTSPKKILQDLYVLFRMRDDTVRAGSISKELFEKVA
jgi:hypothetical protein